MSRVRIESFAVSVDGYAAGPDQALAHPVGSGGLALFAGLDLPALGWRRTDFALGESAMHLRFSRTR